MTMVKYVPIANLEGPQGIDGQTGPAPELLTGTTTQVEAGTAAEMTLTQVSPGRYRVDSKVPKGIDGDPSAVADLDDASSSLVNTKGTKLQTALNAQSVQTMNERLPYVVIGPTGEYPTINEALDAYPSGRVHLALQPGEHVAETLPSDGGMTAVILSGSGRYSCTLDVAGPLVSAVQGQDFWEVRDFRLRNSVDSNTHDGIAADYPRRWIVEKMEIEGYGGTSVWYQGGLNSRVSENYIRAKDRGLKGQGANGKAGVRFGKALTGAQLAATTLTSRDNYIGTGVEYGYLFEDAATSCSSTTDIAEWCGVGFRLERTSMRLDQPYTEANVIPMEFHDARPVFIGETRDEPIVRWSSGVAIPDRRFVRITSDMIDPGKGFFRGGPTADRDPATAPGVQWVSGNPEGSLIGPKGSIAIRMDPAMGGAVIYVKDSDTGTTGWVPLGTRFSSAAELLNPAYGVNTQGKRRGTEVFNTTNNRPVYAAGASPTDAWHYSDGAVAYTPS